MSSFIVDPVIYRCRLLSRKRRDVDPFVAVGACDLNPAMGISQHRCIRVFVVFHGAWLVVFISAGSLAIVGRHWIAQVGPHFIAHRKEFG
jgi:hypothetical protein